MSNVVAAPATSGGFVANFLYCAYLLRKNSTLKNFSPAELRVNWLYGAAMGALWFGGLALYGLGIYRMGDFGAVVGWPLLMGAVIVTSNAAGFLTGEWAGTGARVRVYLGTGMAIILLALWILALAQRP
jgi:L-rhamnose-H+ transport protein